ncbi:MAG: hypothetical protein ACTH5W_15435 [Providencia sp.]|uniref:hypothetical protein n=1 Tax=Providencia sp. TaxID=589 RepID=UPI003F9DCC3B
MSWKPVVAAVGLVIYMILFIGSGIYLLADNTCGIDKVSLEKRCQSAVNHYKGR